MDVIYATGNGGQLQMWAGTHLSGTTTLTPDVFIMGAARRVAGAIGRTPLATRLVEMVKSESILCLARLFFSSDGAKDGSRGKFQCPAQSAHPSLIARPRAVAISTLGSRTLRSPLFRDGETGETRAGTTVPHAPRDLESRSLT